MELKAGSVIRSFDQERLLTKEPTMRKLVDLFCHVDDFCQAFLPQWQKWQLESGERKRNRKGNTGELTKLWPILVDHYSTQLHYSSYRSMVQCGRVT